MRRGVWTNKYVLIYMHPIRAFCANNVNKCDAGLFNLGKNTRFVLSTFDPSCSCVVDKTKQLRWWQQMFMMRNPTLHLHNSADRALYF